MNNAPKKFSANKWRFEIFSIHLIRLKTKSEGTDEITDKIETEALLVSSTVIAEIDTGTYVRKTYFFTPLNFL